MPGRNVGDGIRVGHHPMQEEKLLETGELLILYALSAIAMAALR